MTAGGHVQSPYDSGFTPRRHHDENYDLAERLVGFSVIAEYDESGAALQNEGGLSDPLTIGDDQGWVLWRSAGVGVRAVSSFSTAFSVVVVDKDAMVPIYEPGEPDDRYETKSIQLGQDLPRTPVFPTGHTGHVSAAMIEDKQEEVFHPDWNKALVSVSEPGADQDISDELYDVNTRGGLHPTRHAPIHRLMQALTMSFTSGGGGTRTRGTPIGAIGLNLTHSGGNDQTITGLPFIDNEEGTIGLGSNTHGGGPFLVGCTKHRHGIDDLGRSIHPLHLSANSLWSYGEDQDAPFRFNSDHWRPRSEITSSDQGGWWEEVDLVYDPTGLHWVSLPDGSYEQHPGLFRWQVPVALLLQDAPNGIPSFEGTRTRNTLPGAGGGSGGGSGGSGGSGSGSGGDSGRNRTPFKNPGFKGRKSDGRRVDQSRKGAIPPSQQNPPWQWPRQPGKGPKGGGKKPKGGGKKPKPFKPDESSLDPILFGPEVEPPRHTGDIDDGGGGGGDEKVVPNKADNCPPRAVSNTQMMTPGLTFFALPNDPNATNLKGVGGAVFREALKTAPGTSQFNTIALGTGTSDGQKSTNTPCGWPVAEESLTSMTGAGDSYAKTLAGRFDPGRDAKTASSTTHFNIPSGMSKISTGHPIQSNTQVVTGGHEFGGNSDGEFVIHPVGTDGTPDTAVGMVMDEDGMDLKGDVTINGVTPSTGGGTNSIGGSGDDGAVDLSANASYGAVQNSTTWQLQASYNVYSGINKPLVIKTTGSHTLNGSVLMQGRGFNESA